MDPVYKRIDDALASVSDAKVDIDVDQQDDGAFFSLPEMPTSPTRMADGMASFSDAAMHSEEPVHTITKQDLENVAKPKNLVFPLTVLQDDKLAPSADPDSIEIKPSSYTLPVPETPREYNITKPVMTKLMTTGIQDVILQDVEKAIQGDMSASDCVDLIMSQLIMKPDKSSVDVLENLNKLDVSVISNGVQAMLRSRTKEISRALSSVDYTKILEVVVYRSRKIEKTLKAISARTKKAFKVTVVSEISSLKKYFSKKRHLVVVPYDAQVLANTFVAKPACSFLIWGLSECSLLRSEANREIVSRDLEKQRYFIQETQGEKKWRHYFLSLKEESVFLGYAMQPRSMSPLDSAANVFTVIYSSFPDVADSDPFFSKNHLNPESPFQIKEIGDASLTMVSMDPNILSTNAYLPATSRAVFSVKDEKGKKKGRKERVEFAHGYHILRADSKELLFSAPLGTSKGVIKSDVPFKRVSLLFEPNRNIPPKMSITEGTASFLVQSFYSPTTTTFYRVIAALELKGTVYGAMGLPLVFKQTSPAQLTMETFLPLKAKTHVQIPPAISLDAHVATCWYRLGISAKSGFIFIRLYTDCLAIHATPEGFFNATETGGLERVSDLDQLFEKRNYLRVGFTNMCFSQATYLLASAGIKKPRTCFSGDVRKEMARIVRSNYQKTKKPRRKSVML